jgi:2-oxoglutarate ferredoxin oxidoreductase subunit alpha
VRTARAEGIPVGLLRPITVSPFPSQFIQEAAAGLDGMLVVEMNSGQMLEDILLATKSSLPIDFYGRMGGTMPFPDEILGEIRRMAQQPMKIDGHPRDRWLERTLQVN